MVNSYQQISKSSWTTLLSMCALYLSLLRLDAESLQLHDSAGHEEVSLTRKFGDEK